MWDCPVCGGGDLGLALEHVFVFCGVRFSRISCDVLEYMLEYDDVGTCVIT